MVTTLRNRWQRGLRETADMKREGDGISLCSTWTLNAEKGLVSDAIQPSHPLSSPSPPAPNPSQHQSFSNESALHIRWPKY